MGSILKLIVPEHDQREDVIRAYYEYVLEKEQTIRPDLDRNRVEELVEYQNAMRVLEEKDRFFVYENLSSTIARAMDMSTFYDVICQGNNYDDPIIDDPEDIETVIDLLRDAKTELLENPPVDVDWELNLEAKTIALCEFALKHGYGVKLSE